MPVKGNAAFTWTTAEGQEGVHLLGAPLRDLRPRIRQRRFVHESADGSAVNVVTVGSGLWEMEATIRFDALPTDLLKVMQDGFAQQTLRYTHDLTSPGYDFDAKLIPGDGLALDPDPDLWFRGEYTVRVLLRRTDGGDFSTVLGTSIAGAKVVMRLRGGESLDRWTFSRTAVSGADRYVKRDGTLGEVTTDGIARTEWLDTDDDGARETPSLLLEMSRSNGWTYSEQLDNAAWTKTRVSITADNGTAPDGTATADAVIEDTSNNTHYVERNTPGLDGGYTSTFSCFAKAGGRTWISLQVVNRDNDDARVSFDLSNGATGTATDPNSILQDYAIEELGSDWYRCWISVANGSGATTSVARVYLLQSDGVISYTGDGSSGVSLWGLQYEAASTTYVDFPTSYIKTEASTVTRNAETVYRDLPSALSTPTALAVYGRIVVPYERAGNNAEYGLFRLGGAAASGNRFELAWETGTTLRLRHIAASTQAADLTVAADVGDTLEFVALLSAAGAPTLIASLNGAAATSQNGTAVALGSSWAGTRLYLNSLGSANHGATNLRDLVVVKGVPSGTASAVMAAFRRLVEQS